MSRVAAWATVIQARQAETGDLARVYWTTRRDSVGVRCDAVDHLSDRTR